MQQKYKTITKINNDLCRENFLISRQSKFVKLDAELKIYFWLGQAKGEVRLGSYCQEGNWNKLVINLFLHIDYFIIKFIIIQLFF